MQEFKNVYSNLCPNEQEATVTTTVDDIFVNVDEDGDGNINFREWQTAMIPLSFELLKDQDEDNRQRAFDFFDIDRSGDIDGDELNAMLGNDDSSESIDWREVIQKYVREKGGKLKFE